MMEERVKIGFIGAGSIGSLFGGYLSDIKSKKIALETIFFCREEHAKKINLEGLKINLNGDIRVIKKIRAYSNYDDYKNHYLKKDISFDFLFLSTKTYDLPNVFSEYKEILYNSKFLVVLQNGIGNEEFIEKYYQKERIIRLITSHGAYLEKPGYLYHTGIGFTYIGFPFLNWQMLCSIKYQFNKSQLNLLKTLLDLAKIDTELAKDINEKIWEKAFSNIGINAIGALTRLKNGNILENENLREIMAEAVKEALKVAELKKIKLSNRDYVELTYSVARKTYNNRNSMLQDILKGKRTEIDFLNGKILQYAKKLGIKVPINKILTSLIKGLEKS